MKASKLESLVESYNIENLIATYNGVKDLFQIWMNRDVPWTAFTTEKANILYHWSGSLSGMEFTSHLVEIRPLTDAKTFLDIVSEHNDEDDEKKTEEIEGEDWMGNVVMMLVSLELKSPGHSYYFDITESYSKHREIDRSFC